MEITKKVILAKREETPVEWEKHKEINHQISEDFQKSLDNFDEKLYGNIEPITNCRIYCQDVLYQIPYGPNTTIGKSGCAICVLEHALIVQGRSINIANLAEEVYKEGYLCEVYKEGRLCEIKGTYHNLFDEHKNGFCKRANNYKQIFDNLKAGKMVTLLVNNEKYYEDSSKGGAHFINVIGKKDNLLIIEDSNEKTRIEKDCLAVFKSTNVAWLWL